MNKRRLRFPSRYIQVGLTARCLGSKFHITKLYYRGSRGDGLPLLHKHLGHHSRHQGSNDGGVRRSFEDKFANRRLMPDGQEYEKNSRRGER